GFLEVGFGEGEEHEPGAGGVHGPAVADAAGDGADAGADGLDVDDLHAVADAQLDVAAGDLVQVLDVRERGFAEPEPAGGEGGQLQQAQAHRVAAGAVAFERAPVDELAGEAVGGGQGEPGPAG